MVAAIALPALVLAIVLIVQSYRNEQAYAATQLLSTARAIAGVVDGEVDKMDATLKTIAVSPELLSDDYAGIEALARRAVTEEQRWFVLCDASGKQLINTRLPAGNPLDGRVIDTSFLKAGSPGQRYVSDLEFSADHKTSVIHIEEPWMNQGRLRYALSIGVRPASLARAVNVSGFAPGSIVVVIDRQGRILARSLSPDQFVGRNVRPDFYREMAAHAEGVELSASLENIPVLSAFCRTKAGWTVAIAIPRNQLYSESQRLLLWAVGVSAVLTGVAILLAGWISRTLLRSVDALSEDAEAMGRGEMPKRSSSELAETALVAGAMYRTADLLRQRTLDNASLNADLEAKVEQRTASLRDAVTQMEEFSYTVSHDLRSPLRAMQGYAQILLEENRAKLDESALVYLQRIERAAQRMDHLTSDLLDYTRLARGTVEIAPVNVDAMVRNAIEHYIELYSSGATVNVEYPLLPVMGHDPSLLQAVSNLFTNAVKYVKPGEKPHITVRTERLGSRVRIWVEDHGIGIAPQYQAGLFRMFERLPTSGKYEGTGIGLAIVRKAAEKMGGSCGVVSDGQSGSRFWIELAAA